jgi:hypothetical protein
VILMNGHVKCWSDYGAGSPGLLFWDPRAELLACSVTSLRFGRDDKGKVVMDRTSGQGTDDRISLVGAFHSKYIISTLKIDKHAGNSRPY